MPLKPVLKKSPSVHNEAPRLQSVVAPAPGPHRVNGNNASGLPIRAVPSASTANKEFCFQPRIPVIIGEASYRGIIPVDGTISGQLGAVSGLTIKQRPRSNPENLVPELNGEITFKDMLRVNGFVAGKISSCKGTLIVDNSARVDANIDVGVCVVSGTVNGDVVAQERVELGPAAVINGDISTGSLSMRPGATFTGNCRMIKAEEVNK